MLFHIKNLLDNFDSLPVKIAPEVKRLFEAISFDIQEGGSDHLKLVQIEEGDDPIVDLLREQDTHAGLPPFVPIESSTKFTGLSLLEQKSETDQKPISQVLEAKPIDYLKAEFDRAEKFIANAQYVKSIELFERISLAIQKNLEVTSDSNEVTELQNLLRNVLFNLSTIYDQYSTLPKTNEKPLEEIDYVNMALDALGKIQTLCGSADHNEFMEPLMVFNNLICNDHKRKLLIQNALASIKKIAYEDSQSIDSVEVKDKAKQQILKYMAEIKDHLDILQATLEQYQEGPDRDAGFQVYIHCRMDLATANIHLAYFLGKVVKNQIDSYFEEIRCYQIALEIFNSISKVSSYKCSARTFAQIQVNIAIAYNKIVAWHAARDDKDVGNIYHHTAKSYAQKAQFTLNTINLDDLTPDDLSKDISITGNNLAALYGKDIEIAERLMRSGDWLSAIKLLEDLMHDIVCTLSLKIFKNTTVGAHYPLILESCLVYLSTTYYKYSLTLYTSEQAIEYMHKAKNLLPTIKEMQKKTDDIDCIAHVTEHEEDLISDHAILMIKHNFNLIKKLNNVEDKLKNVESKNQMIEYITQIDFYLSTLSKIAEGCKREQTRNNIWLDFSMCKVKSAEANFMLGDYLLQLHKTSLSAELKPEEQPAVNNYLSEAIIKYKKSTRVVYTHLCSIFTQRKQGIRQIDRDAAEMLFLKCHRQIDVCHTLQKQSQVMTVFSQERHSYQFFTPSTGSLPNDNNEPKQLANRAATVRKGN